MRKGFDFFFFLNLYEVVVNLGESSSVKEITR